MTGASIIRRVFVPQVRHAKADSRAALVVRIVSRGSDAASRGSGVGRSSNPEDGGAAEISGPAAAASLPACPSSRSWE